MDKYIGKLLGGRYEIIDVVGVGGMAVVYRARCHVLNRYVAVKILKEEYARDPDIRKRFSIESQAVAKLSHHNIVSVYDVGSEAGTDYIVMELIEGVTLKEYLQKKGYLPWQEALFFAQQISRALMHAHSRGIIHQDIKPQNVIILRDGTAKITDFGIASFATTQETRVVQEAIGSVHYISPEQAKGSKIDYRADIYSLGVVMYEMLTGKLPFEGETALQVVMQHLNAVPLAPSEIRPDIPKGMDEIVMHAMCANIARRYASAEALLADLDRLKSDAGAQFDYAAMTDAVGETQVLDRSVQQAARCTPVSPARDQMPLREPEPEGFFDRLAERPGLAAGVAVAVFAVIAFFVVGILLFTGGGREQRISVPPLVGRDIAEIMADAEVNANFTIREAETRVESNRPVGEVLEQTPRTGENVVKGTVITLTVSAGGDHVKDTYKIVDFKGRTPEYVQAAVSEENIVLRTEEEASDTVEKGQITRTEPAAGQELARGGTLILYVSTGKAQKDIPVPDLFGMTQNAAQKALEDRGLALGSVEPVASEASVGTVIWQSAEKGTAVAEGTAVNIQISSGPQQTPPETQTPPESQDPAAPGGEGGAQNEGGTPAVGYASISVPLPATTDIAHVIISVDGVVQYDKTHETGAGSVTVRVNGSVGTHEVSVSVDGSVTTATHTFS